MQELSYGSFIFEDFFFIDVDIADFIEWTFLASDKVVAAGTLVPADIDDDWSALFY